MYIYDQREDDARDDESIDETIARTTIRKLNARDNARSFNESDESLDELRDATSKIEIATKLVETQREREEYDDDIRDFDDERELLLVSSKLLAQAIESLREASYCNDFVETKLAKRAQARDENRARRAIEREERSCEENRARVSS